MEITLAREKISLTLTCLNVLLTRKIPSIFGILLSIYIVMCRKHYVTHILKQPNRSITAWSHHQENYRLPNPVNKVRMVRRAINRSSHKEKFFI